jgi:hypothetical protein
MHNALRSRRMLAGVGAGLALLIACVAWFVPYLTRERQNLAGVPVPPPVIAQTPVKIGSGSEACLSDVAFDTDAEFVQLTALSAPRPPLEVVARAPGYRETGGVPGGREALSAMFARIDPPERSIIGTLCIRNRGKRRILLLGTSDARTSVGRPVTRIDGAESAPDISVSLFSADQGSVLERLGQLVDRAAAFKPGLLGLPVFLWIVLLLAAIGIPAAALYAMLSSLREAD